MSTFDPSETRLIRRTSCLSQAIQAFPESSKLRPVRKDNLGQHTTIAQDYQTKTCGFRPKNLSLGKGLERTSTVPL